MREKVLARLNKENEEKVMLSFKTDAFNKHIFEKVCKHEGYSMSSVLNALLETYVSEFYENEYREIRKTMNRINEMYQSFDRDDTSQNYEKTIKELDNLKEKLFSENKKIFALNDVDTEVSTDYGDYDEKLIPEKNDIHSISIDPMSQLGVISGLKRLMELKIEKDKK